MFKGYILYKDGTWLAPNSKAHELACLAQKGGLEGNKASQELDFHMKQITREDAVRSGKKLN